MLQELFRIPYFDRPVYGYGLMLVLAFVFGAQLMKYLARRHGFNGDHFVTASLLALVAGVVGARLSHVIENWSHFTRSDVSVGQNLLNMLNVSSGGLTFYGGFLFATPALILYAIWKKVPVLKGMDIVAPCLMLGLAFGRVGCFLNGCCYGEECSADYGVRFPYGSNAYVDQFHQDYRENLRRAEQGQPPKPGSLTPPRELFRTEVDPKTRHPVLDAQGRPMIALDAEGIPILKPATEVRRDPKLAALAEANRARPVHATELYSVLNALLICAALVAFLTLAPAPGRVFALMLVLKGITRFLLEMIRVEPPVLGRMSFSMVVSVGLMAAGALMWVVCGLVARRREGRGPRAERKGFEGAPAPSA